MAKPRRPARSPEPPLKLRTGGADDVLVRPPAPPHHHPLVAISLILLIASAAQVGAWALTSRLLTPTWSPPGAALHYGVWLHTIGAHLSESEGAAALPVKLIFGGSLVLSLTTAAAWFIAGRAAIGIPWGIFTGLVWALHPAFAFVASRAIPLNASIVLTGWLAAALIWWRYRGQRSTPAIAAGVLAGLLALTSVAGLLLIPLVLPTMTRARGRRWRRWRSAIFFAGIAIGVVLAGRVFFPPAAWQTARNGWDADLATQVVEDPRFPLSRTSTTRAGEASGTEWAWGEIVRAARQSPVQLARWYGVRLIRTVFTTTDHRFERPLLALQLAFLVPAMWGAWVAWQHPPWRWLVVFALVTGLAFWCSAALLEPLARNLTPVGGFPILLALLGCADLYERVFGRRLVEPITPLPKRRARRKSQPR